MVPGPWRGAYNGPAVNFMGSHSRTQRVGVAPFHRDERDEIVAALIGDPEIAATIDRLAAVPGADRAALAARVSAFAHEVVPHFRPALYHRIAYRAARRVARALFRVRVGHVDEFNLSRIPADAAVVFVVNHRSNMDYVLVAFLAAEHVALSYAVGEWARVWPLDTLVRSLGGFFVRRSSNDPLYRRVLERYVQMALERGIVQAVFPEAGLSRDGRFRTPKVGILAYMLRAFPVLGHRDLVFVPVAINYDRVIEDRTLLRDGDGEAVPVPWPRVVRTTVGWVAKNLGLYVLGRFYRFGYACVNFGTPISLREYAATRGLDLGGSTSAQRGREAERLVAVLMSAVAAVFCDAGGDGVSRAALVDHVGALLGRVAAAGGRSYVPRNDPDYFVTVGLRMLKLRGLVEDAGTGEFRICQGERRTVEYYANAIAHLRRDAS
jgi:glycerol-3-phosphate O-acyltransferase